MFRRNLSDEMEEAMTHSPEYRIQQLEEQVEGLKTVLTNALRGIQYYEAVTDILSMDRLGPKKLRVEHEA